MFTQPQNSWNISNLSLSSIFSLSSLMQYFSTRPSATFHPFVSLSLFSHSPPPRFSSFFYLPQLLSTSSSTPFVVRACNRSELALIPQRRARSRALVTACLGTAPNTARLTLVQPKPLSIPPPLPAAFSRRDTYTQHRMGWESGGSRGGARDGPCRSAVRWIL